MNKIVIDTNILVALLDNKDVHHKTAKIISQKIEENNKEIVIMDCILNEIYSVIARRCKEKGRKFSEVINKIRIKLENIDKIDAYSLLNKFHNEIVELMIKQEGLINYHDALIIIVMRENDLKEIATLDKGYKNIKWLKIIT